MCLRLWLQAGGERGNDKCGRMRGLWLSLTVHTHTQACTWKERKALPAIRSFVPSSIVLPSLSHLREAATSLALRVTCVSVCLHVCAFICAVVFVQDESVNYGFSVRLCICGDDWAHQLLLLI